MTLGEALTGKEVPNEIKKNLTLISVGFFSFDGKVRQGELVIHTDLAEDLCQIFKTLLEMRFPIQQITPIAAYAWDDDASMAENNTLAFNYRYYDSLASGTHRLSITPTGAR